MIAGKIIEKLFVAIVALRLLGASATEEETILLRGDTHLHTSYSPDAYALGNGSADPDLDFGLTAFYYARVFQIYDMHMLG